MRWGILGSPGLTLIRPGRESRDSLSCSFMCCRIQKYHSYVFVQTRGKQDEHFSCMLVLQLGHIVFCVFAWFSIRGHRPYIV